MAAASAHIAQSFHAHLGFQSAVATDWWPASRSWRMRGSNKLMLGGPFKPSVGLSGAVRR
jgi:hypothetical protein